MKKNILKILILSFFLYGILMILITSFLYENGFKYSKFITTEESNAKFANYPNLTRTRYEIQSKDDITLVGYLYTFKKAQKSPKGLIILSHGLGMTHNDYLHEIEYFSKNDYLVFGFDNTGSGESGGTSVKGLSRSVIDLDYVLTFLENTKEFQNIPFLLYGHSWGGFATCAVNNKPHKVSAIAERSGFNTAAGIIYDTISKTTDKKTANLLAPFIHIYEWIKFGKYSIYSAVEGINNTDASVLLLHSYDDPVVPFNSSAIGKKAEITNPNVTIQEFTNKSHYITSKVENGQITGVDTAMLKTIVNFYDNAI